MAVHRVDLLIIIVQHIVTGIGVVDALIEVVHEAVGVAVRSAVVVESIIALFRRRHCIVVHGGSVVVAVVNTT